MNVGLVRRTLHLALVFSIVLGYASICQADELSRAQLSNYRVSLVIDNGKVVDVLKLLAAQHDLNLSVPGNIEGEITIALDNVSLVDALDVVTKAASANWYVAGNVIVVKAEGTTDLREFETRLFDLSYMSAVEAKKIVDPIVPEGSSVEVLSRAAGQESSGWDEMLEVTTYPDIMDRVAALVSDVDQPRSLVEIEVKIIETSIRDERKLGLDYPSSISATLGDLETESEVEGFATHPIDGGEWTWGRMTAGEVTFLLDYLIQDGRSKLLSNPRVTTLSNQEAEIEVATTIPVQTLNRFSEGGIIQDIVSFQDLDVSINLRVTPRVNEDSVIILDVESSVEEITGYTGPVDNQRPITSRRSVTSSVIVRDGESLGLGGLMKDVEHKTIKKFPLLGYIPILGRLFQHHNTSREKAELMILITPHILPTP